MSNSRLANFSLRTFEDSNGEKARNVRDFIKNDVDHSTHERNDLLRFRTAHKYNFLFSPSKLWAEEIQEKIESSINDTDMQLELERAGAIDRLSPDRLFAVKTTSDGNCLLHAVSTFMWGVDDEEKFLRRMLYWAMCDKTDSFRQRWLLQRREEDQMLREHFPEFRARDYTDGWEKTKEAATDTINERNGLHFFLEGLHIFVLANILRRPIIVYSDGTARTIGGEGIQDNNIRGIYLPLLSRPETCVKSPIAIGYHFNHFTPLLFREINTQGVREPKYRIPVGTRDGDTFPVRFLTGGEKEHETSILKSYLNLTEVTSVAEFTVTKLPVCYNLIVDYTDFCGQLVRQSSNNLKLMSVSRSEPPSLCNQQIVSIPSRCIPGIQQFQPEHCSTQGCTMYGLPEQNGLCSRCYKANCRNNSVKLSPVMGERSKNISGKLEKNDEFVDLSVMGEKCHNCGKYRCSEKTFPYCHDCVYFRTSENTRSAKPNVLADRVQCRGEWCTGVGRNNQDGLCDKCFQTGSQGKREKKIASSNKKTLKLDIEVRYCSTQGCGKPVHSPDLEKCSQCFLKRPETYVKSPNSSGNTPNVYRSDLSKIPTVRTRECADEDIITQNKRLGFRCKTKNCLSVVYPPVDFYCEPCKIFKKEYGHNNPDEHRSLPFCDPQKCGTPRCTGFRAQNRLKCWPCLKNDEEKQNVHSTGRSVSPLDEKNLDLSAMSETRSETCPIFQRCKYEKCTNLASSSSGLCSECVTALDEARGQSSTHIAPPDGMQRMASEQTSVGPSLGSKCLTPGCELYGDPIQDNYCNACYKNRQSDSQTGRAVNAVGLDPDKLNALKSAQPTPHYVPTVAPSKTEFVPTQTEFTYNNDSNSILTPSNTPFTSLDTSGLLRHLARSAFAVPPEQSQGLPGTFRPIRPGSDYVAAQQAHATGRLQYPTPSCRNPVQRSETTAQREAAGRAEDGVLQHMEAERRGRRCKNISCRNYGNPKCFGYCNFCHDQYVKHYTGPYKHG